MKIKCTDEQRSYGPLANFNRHYKLIILPLRRNTTLLNWQTLMLTETEFSHGCIFINIILYRGAIIFTERSLMVRGVEQTQGWI